MSGQAGATNGEHVVVPMGQTGQQQPGLEEEKKEKMINRYVIQEMILASVVSSIGTVGFVWATVVLLGGYVSKLNSLDFWCVSVLSFLQGIRIIGIDWNRDQKILDELLQDSSSPSTANSRTDKNMFQNVLSFVRRLVCCIGDLNSICSFYEFLLCLGESACALAAFMLRRLRILAPVAWALLTFLHIFSQSQLQVGDTQHDKETANLRPALDLFFYVAAVQAVLSYISYVYSLCRKPLLRDISNVYGCQDSNDKPIELYYYRVRRICRDQGITKTKSLTIASLALESLNSDEKRVRLDGIKILDNLTTIRWREEAISKVRDSAAAIESLFKMMVSTNPDEAEERERAASVMARAADGLHVSEFPIAMRSICSLLETGDTEANSTGNSANLIQQGLTILEQLTRRFYNLAVISKSDELMSKITSFTSPAQVSALQHGNAVRNEDVQRRSLELLRRLAGLEATGGQGIKQRQRILGNITLASNIREILKNRNIDPALLKLAIGIAAGFALDPEVRNCGTTKKITTVLLGIFCGEDAAANDDVRAAAGEALARLTTDSEPNCVAILDASNFKALCGMLFSEEHVTRRVTIANILQNLCAYSKLGQESIHRTVELDEFIGFNIKKVLRKISEEVNEEHLEAFLGLGLQFSKRSGREVFCQAMHQDIGFENFVKKLMCLLVQANEQIPLLLEANNLSDIRPGIRRFILEWAIWMIPSENDGPSCFLRNGLQEALSNVQDTPEMIENYKHLPVSVSILEHEDRVLILEYEDTLFSLVKKAKMLISDTINTSGDS